MNSNMAMHKAIIQQNKIITELDARICRLEQQDPTHSRQHNFIEYRGGFFKKNPLGGYHIAVYCPVCLFPMNKFNDTHYIHSRCDQSFDTDGVKLKDLIKKLPK